MIALVVASGTSSALLLGGIVVALGLAVLIAHWASPKTKRLVVVGAAVVSLAVIAPKPMHAEEDEFLMQNPCEKYPPYHPMWWIAGCPWP